MKTTISALLFCAMTAFCAKIPVSGSGLSECYVYSGGEMSNGWTLSFAGSADGIDVGLYIGIGKGWCDVPPASGTSAEGTQEGYGWIGDFTSEFYSYELGGGGGFLEVGAGADIRHVDLVSWTLESSGYVQGPGYEGFVGHLKIMPVPEPGGLAFFGLAALAGLAQFRRIR